MEIPRYQMSVAGERLCTAATHITLRWAGVADAMLIYLKN